MPLDSIAPTKGDFDNCDWKGVLAQCEEAECHKYSMAFGDAAKEASANENMACRDVFALLGAVTSLMFKLDSPEGPFGPLYVFEDFRAPIVADFTEQQLDVLAAIVQDSTSSELTARIADLLWLRRHDYRMAVLAVDSYLESAIALLANEQWVHATERIERALQLGASLGKNNAQYDQVLRFIENELQARDCSTSLYICANLLRLLLERKHGDPAHYASVAENGALAAAQASQELWEEEFWNLKAKWHRLASESEQEKEALVAAAEVHVKSADEALTRERPSHMVAEHHLVNAIEGLRRIGGDEQRIEELHRRLIEYRKATLSELHEISHTVDLTDAALSAIEQVKGKTLDEAIRTLAFIGEPPELTSMRETLIERMKEMPLQFLFQSFTLDASGRVVAVQPGLAFDDSEAQEAAIRVAMWQECVHYHSILVLGAIEPIRQQIILEHGIRVHDMHRIVSNRPLVPPGRELIYAKGLYAGITGDHLTACHLLIPQLENSLRYLLKQRGSITTGLTAEGVQQEYELGKLLSEFKKELEDIFDADTVFDLQGFLVSPFATNFRNLLAHGLFDEGVFFTTNAIYAWWIVLHMCLKLSFVQGSTDSNSEA